MKWFTKLRIRQLKKAATIAAARGNLAYEHGDGNGFHAHYARMNKYLEKSLALEKSLTHKDR